MSDIHKFKKYFYKISKVCKIEEWFQWFCFTKKFEITVSKCSYWVNNKKNRYLIFGKFVQDFWALFKLWKYSSNSNNIIHTLKLCTGRHFFYSWLSAGLRANFTMFIMDGSESKSWVDSFDLKFPKSLTKDIQSPSSNNCFILLRCPFFLLSQTITSY